MAAQVKRRYLIAGNWKMNKLSSEAEELASAIVHDLGTQTEVHVALALHTSAFQKLQRL